MRSTHFKAALPVFLFLLFTACAKSKSSTSSPDDGPSSGHCQKEALPDVSSASSQVVMSVSNATDICLIDGYIVGLHEVLRLKRASDGSLFIDKVPQGWHDIIVTERPAASLSLQGPKGKGARLSKRQFLNGIRHVVEPLSLPEAGAIVGKINPMGSIDKAGITVYIPGTSFIAKTDDNGAFVLENVPVGTHNLIAEKDGYYKGRFEDLSVEPSAPRSLGEIALAPDTGAEGQMILASGGAEADSRTVRVTIATGDEALLMKVSENGDFKDAKWHPLQTSFDYTFATPGKKTLYAKLANANGLESSPFSASVDVVLFPSVSDLKLNGGASLSSSRHITVSAIPPKNAVQQIVSTSASLTGAAWQNVAESWQLSLPGDGLRKVYLKYRDRDGFESPVFQAEITVDVFFNQSLGLTLDAEEIVPPETNVSVRATLPQNAAKMMIWSDVDLSPSWQGLAQQTTYKLPRNNTSCGPRTIFLKVADVDGIESRTTSQSLNVACWKKVSQVQAPNPASVVHLFWTGSRVIVWGDNAVAHLYNPATDEWTKMSSANSPKPDSSAAAVWTGAKMITFGGRDINGPTGDGASYDPETDTWMKISLVGAPSARSHSITAWTGTEMLVWGGYGTNTEAGALYNPATDTWRSMTSSGAPVARTGSAHAWTGSKILLWGGMSLTGYPNTYYADGKTYDPLTNSWADVTNLSAPSGRAFAWSTVINGALFMTGGSTSDAKRSNDSFYLTLGETPAWSAIPDAPLADISTDHPNVKPVAHDGRVYLLGVLSGMSKRAGAVFDTATNTWSLMPSAGGPSPRHYVSSILAGDQIFIWGGVDNNVQTQNDGYLFRGY